MLLYDTFRIRDLDSFQLETEIWPASATTKSPLFFSLEEAGKSFDPFDVDLRTPLKLAPGTIELMLMMTLPMPTSLLYVFFFFFFYYL